MCEHVELVEDVEGKSNIFCRNDVPIFLQNFHFIFHIFPSFTGHWMGGLICVLSIPWDQVGLACIWRYNVSVKPSGR